MRPKRRLKKIDSRFTRHNLRLQQIKVLEQERTMANEKCSHHWREQTMCAKQGDKHVTAENFTSTQPQHLGIMFILDRFSLRVCRVLLYEFFLAALEDLATCNLPIVEGANRRNYKGIIERFFSESEATRDV